MNQESANTSGPSQSEGSNVGTAKLSSLADATAHILTALKSDPLPASSAINSSETQANSSLAKAEENTATPTTEVVTKQHTQTETKTKEKTMKTKKSKAEKKLTIARMLVRLDKIQTYRRLAAKMNRWLEDEKDEARRLDLTKLRDRFDALVTEQQSIRAVVEGLQAVNYVPPKKNFSGAMALEHGRQVWIKPKFIGIYTVSGYKEDALNNLFVDQVVGGNVVVSVGSPDEEVAFKFPVAKLRLQVTSPST